MQFGDRTAIHENEKQSAAPLHAQGIEREPPVIIQLHKHAECFIGCLVNLKRDHIVFRDRRDFFDGHVLAGKRRTDLGGERSAVAGVRFRMQTKGAMRLLSIANSGGERRENRDGRERFHGRLINGLTGFATFGD